MHRTTPSGRPNSPLATTSSSLAFGLLLVMATAPACGDDEPEHEHHHDPDSGAVSVDASVESDAAVSGRASITFANLVNGTAITLGSDTPHTNAAGNAFGVSRVSYFVSEVTLHLANGDVIAAAGAHYVDQDTPSTLNYELDIDVPVGELSSVSFVMGLSSAFNVSGTFPNEPESLMEWPEMLGGGYHYMKFEGRYINAADEPFNFKAHTGPAHGVDYSFPVSLDAGSRVVGTDDVTLTLEMNLEQWFTEPNTWDLNDHFTQAKPGMMGNAGEQAAIQANGATVFSLGAP